MTSTTEQGTTRVWRDYVGIVIFLCASTCVSIVRAAPPTLAPVFSDSMVLQQGVSVPVWGTADVGASVTVTLASQRKHTQADGNGKWAVTFDALMADVAPRELNVSTGENTIVIHDILVGEVWVAAGQSNMEWPLVNEAHANTELPIADHPQLRLYNLNYAGQGYFAKPYDSDVLQRLTPGKFYQGKWQLCTSQSAQEFSAVGYYFGQELHQSLKVPVGVIHLAVGGSPAEAWIRPEALSKDEELAALVKGNWIENESQEPWCRQRGRENLAIAIKNNLDSPHDERGRNHPFKPGFLWNAGIAQLTPFPIRGVIWYQGESNSLDIRRVQQHERLFPLLVNDWRTQWGIGEFPFLYCQLSSIGTEKGYKSQYWPEFRDSQRRMLAQLPNTGMAVTSDLGHHSDVHPRNKRDVGHRLAMWALARTYDQKVPYSGPLATSARRDGTKLVVTFDHTDQRLRTRNDQSVIGFEIAGDDGLFQPAEVELGEGTATLWCKSIGVPMHVRYGWQPYSSGNLVNGMGLPASTFQITAKPVSK